MARYKVLKGVAHNTGHSFTSLMNYAGDDYVMGHILRFARSTRRDTLTIDFGGKIRNYLAEGSPVDVGSPIAVVENYWAVMTLKASGKGILKKAFFDRGTCVKIGDPVAIIGRMANAFLMAENWPSRK